MILCDAPVDTVSNLEHGCLSLGYLHACMRVPVDFHGGVAVGVVTVTRQTPRDNVSECG
jgi:hypothetical protein